MRLSSAHPSSPLSRGESLPNSPNSTTSTLSSLTFREFFNTRRMVSTGQSNNGGGDGNGGESDGGHVNRVNDGNHGETANGGNNSNNGTVTNNNKIDSSKKEATRKQIIKPLLYNWSLDSNIVATSSSSSTIHGKHSGSTEESSGSEGFIHVDILADSTDDEDEKVMTMMRLSLEKTPRAGVGGRGCMEKTPRAGVGGRGGTSETVSVPHGSRGRSGRDDGAGNGSWEAAAQKTSSAASLSSVSSSIKAQGTWDIARSFSFRKEKKEQQQQRQQHSQKSRKDQKPREEESTMDDDAASLIEMGENDLFALEVGLMFSADDGDTITYYNPSICGSATMESLDSIFPVNSDLSLNTNHHRTKHTLRNSAHGNDESSSQEDGDDASLGANNYIQNPNYIIQHKHHLQRNQQQQQSVSTGDNESIHTFTPSIGQTTIRDDYGNKIPQNAKMIYHHPTITNNNNDDINARNKQIFPTLIQPTMGNEHYNIQNPNSNANNSNNPEQEMERRLREIAGQLSADWRGSDFMPPALARRLRDFQFAREKRRKKYGNMKPWGILGLYEHLAGVRVDVEWAEDAAWRRKNTQPYLTWADFESTKNEGFNRPFFTFFIVSCCTAMMFTSLLVNGWQFEPISVNPMLGPSAETLILLGAKDSYLIVQESEIWRLVTPMVLHAGLIHYVMNMFALWYVGKAIEQIHGFFPSLVIFVVSAVGGTILSAIFLPEYITVGASGGIFGLIGACISDIVMNWSLLFNEFVNERGARLSHAKALVVLFLDIVVNCLIGLTPFVDNFTHLGGMILGFLCGLRTIQLVSPRFFGDERHYFYKFKLFFFRSFGLIVSMAGIIASSIILFSGDGETNPCTTCTALSCVAFPPWAETNDKWWYCDDCSRATAEGTVDTSTGKFVELAVSCPNGSIETLEVDESWPQSEIGLEGILPMLCREHCLL